MCNLALYLKTTTMKNILKSLVIIIAVFTIQSCESEKTKPLTSSSADGKMNITISAQRESSADPFTVTISCDQFENSATTEIYASTIDSTNVDFNWASNTSCIITFTHRDGTKTPVPVSISK